MVDSAELFEAISHPVRIKILKILEKQPSSFASLKRQLGFASSGNLDFHLKKLGGLVAVRDDGLYGLTQAGREALLSIDEVETRTEMEKRRIKMPKMPKEAFFLGLLELCTTVSLLLFFLAIGRVSLLQENVWGYIFFAGLLFIGFCSSLGVFKQWAISWKMVLAKSALIISMSMFLLIYIWKLGIIQWSSVYLVFVIAEIAAVVLALQKNTRDFLGIETGVKLSILTVVSVSLCILGGILLILLASVKDFSETSTIFDSMFDLSILCGLLIVIGGLLILLGNNTLGAAMSIIFGLFPPPPGTPGLPPGWGAEHLYNIIDLKLNSLPYPLGLLIGGLIGSLPIIGGLMALASSWKTRRYLRVHLKNSFKT